MAKIMVDERKLEEFSEILGDIQFSINMEVNSINVDRQMLYNLVNELMNAWSDIYNPAKITLSRSRRSLFNRYVIAKQSGDLEKADQYLKSYLKLTRDLDKDFQ